jgi:hypothetical protein
MFHACDQRFDVTGTVQKYLGVFGHLNRPLMTKQYIPTHALHPRKDAILQQFFLKSKLWRGEIFRRIVNSITVLVKTVHYTPRATKQLSSY